MSTFLVSGAAGFIAARTCAQLIAAGHSVVGVDNLNDSYDVRLKRARLETLTVSPQFRFCECNIENPAEVASVFEGQNFHTVIHLAGRGGVRTSMDSPALYIGTNAMGTLNILEAMRHSGAAKLVLSSTSSLYAGQIAPFAETLPVNTPISPYAASKKAAELLAYTYHHLFGIDVTVVRYFTVYGPAGRPDMSPFRFMKWIEEGRPIDLYGDGLQSRDFTFVDDIASGTIAATKKVGYEIINLGGGRRPWSINEMIALLEERLEKKARITYHPAHKTDMLETHADIRKADAMLGWSPNIDLPEGLDRMVAWYRDNYAWAKDINV